MTPAQSAWLEEVKKNYESGKLWHYPATFKSFITLVDELEAENKRLKDILTPTLFKEGVREFLDKAREPEA